MNRRPLSITVISGLFMAMGSVALVYHLSELKIRPPFDHELVWVCLVRVLAVVGGAFMLRGLNWARWLLAVWMAYHVVISILHSPVELMMHVLLFGIMGYFLFCPQASAYFHGRSAELPQVPNENDRPAAE